MAELPASLVLRGGLVMDGSGEPARHADVAVRDGVIRAVLPPGTPTDGEAIDVHGMVVCPGFIDSHTHDDRLVLETPGRHPKLSQGVTTVVTGNCGISLAPLVHPAPPAPLDVLGTDAFRFRTFREYLAHLDAIRPAVNVVPLVGHTSVRVSRVTDLTREASSDEIRAMQQDVQEALDAGAFGLSTGVYYPPARAAGPSELKAVCQPLRGRRSVLAMHIRDEGDAIDAALREAFDVASDCGAELVLSHHKVVGLRNHGRTAETLAAIELQAASGRVCLDCYPYEASSTMLDPEKAQRTRNVLVTWSGAHPEHAGRDLASIAAGWGIGLAEAARRLMPGGAIYFGMSATDVDRVVAHPLAMIGSDGLPHDKAPHPRLWGTFPRVIARYARDRKLLSLEAAVRKMTGLPAERFGLRQRGRVVPGHWADLVVFDPRTITDNATYEDPTAAPSGIRIVMVNGCIAMRDGTPLDMHAGRRLQP